MPTMTAGKIMEATATRAAFAAGGTGNGAKYIAAFCREFGLEFAHTDETVAARRGSELYMGGERLNNGRGERLFDAVVAAPIIGLGGAVVEKIPVSLKGGDSRDISTDIPLVRAAVEAGAPIWVYILDGAAVAVEYDDGIRVDVEPARGMTMRRINVTPLLRDCITDWSKAGDSKATPAFIRENKVKKAGKTYLRVRVNWNKVPAHYWLDAVPVAFDAGAPLPCPWW